MQARIKFLIILCISMLAVHIVNIVLNGSLSRYGIAPGNVQSLPWILTAPWLHGNWAHLFGNLGGLAIFGALALIRGVNFFIRSSAIIIVFTGLMVWLLGRSDAIHIGASGWIFGLWSLAIAIAWFDRSFLNIVIAVAVAFFYGGMVWGVLPTNSYVSFESHLFGAIGGVLAAWLMTRKQKKLSYKQ